MDLLVNFLDLKFVAKALPEVLQGVPTSLKITVIAAVLGYLLGLALTFFKVYQFDTARIVTNPLHQLARRVFYSFFIVMRLFANIYTVTIRSIPVIVLLFIVYFGLPSVVKTMTGINLYAMVTDKSVFAIAALVLDISAGSSELFRSGYMAVEAGQLEAGKSLGYNRLQRFWHIIAPQAFYVIIPNIGNNLIALIQNSSLVYTLGIIDILGKSRLVDANIYQTKTLEVYVAAALIYWALTMVVEQLIRLLERRMGYGMRVIGSRQRTGLKPLSAAITDCTGEKA